MKKFYVFVALAALFPAATWAQLSPSADEAVTATGSTTPRTFAARAADVVNVKDYGAKCDGVTDDAAAINAAVTALEARTYAGSSPAARLVFPGGGCAVHSTINLTNLSSTNVTIDGAGTMLFGYTKSAPVINALGMRYVTVRDLSIWGEGGSLPTVGIQIGLGSNAVPADSNTFDNIHLLGSYSLAAFYNYASELTTFDHVIFQNNYTPSGSACYTLIEDGINHFGLSPTRAADTMTSFTANLFKNATVTASNGCTPAWIASASFHKWITSYIANYSGSGYEVVLWAATGGAFVQDDLDIHFETTPTDIFYLTGSNTMPTLVGFRYRDELNQATDSIFKLDPAFTAASLVGGSLEIGQFLSSPKVFDAPGLWTSNQDVFLPAGSSAWNLSSGFSGTLKIGATNAFYGTALGGGTATSGVAGASLAIGGQAGGAGNTSGGSIVLTPGAASGTGTAGAISLGGNTTVTGTLTANALSSSDATITGGSFTGTSISGSSGSFTSVSSAGSVGASGNVTAGGVVLGVGGFVSQPASGTTSGLTLENGSTVKWTLTNNGTSNAFSIWDQSGSRSVLTAVTGGTVTVGSSGTAVVTAGALIDGTGVRTALTTSGYAVPSNTSLVRFTQTLTRASATVTLPTATADGQPIQFVNYAGAVTALTFSPSVNGWTNGSTLAAYTGVRVRWDATAGAWYREQ